MNTRKVVHVLLGSNEAERIFSIYPPEGISPMEWIKRGFTHDRGSVIFRVTPQTGIEVQPEDQPGYPPELVVIGRPDYPRPYHYLKTFFSRRTLEQALQEFETFLVQWLAGLGYDVEFA
jgi:hypothetical protein